MVNKNYNNIKQKFCFIFQTALFSKPLYLKTESEGTQNDHDNPLLHRNMSG